MKKVSCILVLLAMATSAWADPSDGPSRNTETSEPITECVKSTCPFYVDWVTYGRPDCWCCKRNCNGDADCVIQFGLFWVYNNDLIYFKECFAKTELPYDWCICCDFDRQTQFGMFRVYTNDLIILRTYFAQPEYKVPCCDDNQDCVLEPDDSCYNYWTD